MGAKEGKEATPEEVKAFFKENCFSYSGCVDIEKLKVELVSPGWYVTHQYMLEKDFEKVNLATVQKNPKQLKQIFRNGIPDKKKREFIMHHFNFQMVAAEAKYKTIIEMQSEDFLEHTKKAQLAYKSLEYHYLNATGIHQLEIILALLFKERGVKHSPILVQVAALLLIYMKPSEVFYVLNELITSSANAYQNIDQKALIRWHFTLEKQEYFKLLTTFVKSYLNTTKRKKRSVLIHLNKIGFSFTKYVDQSFKTFLTHFVSLPVSLDILMQFLFEGTKIIFRYTYAILKCQKKFVKSCSDPKTFMEELQKVSRTATDPKLLQKKAFAYPLKRKNYDYKKATVDIDQESGLGEDFHDYVPNTPQSNILKYEEFGLIWKMLPDYVRIRYPQLLYAGTTDGFNINNLYRTCEPYESEYKFTLIVIQTTKNQVFGAFIDDMFQCSPKDYIGSSESFVFTIKPEVKCFPDANVNSRYLLTELKYFQIGGEGDGPAIFVNDQLDKGQTNACATFNSPLLTLGQKTIDDTYDIHDIELFIL